MFIGHCSEWLSESKVEEIYISIHGIWVKQVVFMYCTEQYQVAELRLETLPRSDRS